MNLNDTQMISWWDGFMALGLPHYFQNMPAPSSSAFQNIPKNQNAFRFEFTVEVRDICHLEGPSHRQS